MPGSFVKMAEMDPPYIRRLHTSIEGNSWGGHSNSRPSHCTKSLKAYKQDTSSITGPDFTTLSALSNFPMAQDHAAHTDKRLDISFVWNTRDTLNQWQYSEKTETVHASQL